MKQTNQHLRELYLDYLNNYLTVDKLAEHHEIDTSVASLLLDIGKQLHENYVNLVNSKGE
jgi:transglutaminase-like putative cysteine protease